MILNHILYNFIVNETLHRHNGELYNLKWPIEINDCGRKEWVSIVSNGYNMDGEITIRYDIVERETVDYEYIEENGEPEVEGISWEIDIPYILENPKEFSSLISFIENDSFPLKKGIY